MNKKLIIEDILLKMNYDLSKTLTENKEFINEQKTYYYDSKGFLKTLDGPYAIPQGGTPASKVYPNLKPGEYPNFNFSSAGANAKPVPFNKPEIPQSDVLGPQGSYPKSLGVDRKSLETQAEINKFPEPKEFTKKLSQTQLDQFILDRKRISNLPPSIKLKEFKSKNQSAFIKQSMVSPQGFVPTNMDNYQQELSDYTQKYQKSQNDSLTVLNYNLALYYPEKWKENHDDSIDTHVILFAVAVGVFAIPLLLAAAGASATVIAAAGLGAQIVSTAADTADAIVYLQEGDLEMAGLSAIFAVLPFVPNLSRYGKNLIKNAVTKESKGLRLTKQESEVISELNKKETGKQIEAAAEDMAKSKKTPEVDVAIGEGKSKIKTIWKTGGEAVSKASKTKTAELLGTLAGFYLVGQGYHKAVESYKKSKRTSLDIYNTLLKSGKLKLSWEDLKWKFGSSGSKEDNEKLGAALLDGYTDENSDEWLYSHPEYRTQNWNQTWLPVIEKEIQQKKDVDLVKSYNDAKSDEDKKRKKQEVIDTWVTNHILVDKNGVKHDKTEWAEKIKSIRDRKLFD
jgi:hypothetical protein